MHTRPLGSPLGPHPTFGIIPECPPGLWGHLCFHIGLWGHPWLHIQLLGSPLGAHSAFGVPPAFGVTPGCTPWVPQAWLWVPWDFEGLGSCRSTPGTGTCISRFLLWGGVEEPMSSTHRAGHSKISALHPTPQNPTFSTLLLFRKVKKMPSSFKEGGEKKERKICSKLSCVCFLTQ